MLSGKHTLACNGFILEFLESKLPKALRPRKKRLKSTGEMSWRGSTDSQLSGTSDVPDSPRTPPSHIKRSMSDLPTYISPVTLITRDGSLQRDGSLPRDGSLSRDSTFLREGSPVESPNTSPRPPSRSAIHRSNTDTRLLDSMPSANEARLREKIALLERVRRFTYLDFGGHNLSIFYVFVIMFDLIYKSVDLK